jgi:hypothetical protein
VLRAEIRRFHDMAQHPPRRSVAPPYTPSLADSTERLMLEFGTQLDLATISRTVLACRQELREARVGTPALIETLARQRLVQACNESGKRAG